VGEGTGWGIAAAAKAGMHRLSRTIEQLLEGAYCAGTYIRDRVIHGVNLSEPLSSSFTLMLATS